MSNEPIKVDGVITPSGRIIPAVRAPDGEQYRLYCRESGIYRTVSGQVFSMVKDECLVLYNYRPIKSDDPDFGEYVKFLREGLAL